ncbi:unnamed protein product [Linum tenue]|uniref:COP1-interacting protein 7 n=1 Tax=Linum tenue TaxID=586396 RepID=A0AAV0KAS9_9ROSI|nr:unnamed protein product [Linum tenue]
MGPDTSLDYAVFQLSPRHSRCELFVSRNGTTEKLASGLVKPFVTHLKVAEEQVAHAVNSIKLEAGNHRNAETWFTKGTLERFVRFVSTPEVLEMVNTFDAEMSQLEGARKIYSQGGGGQVSSSGEGGTGSVEGADATKKELLRAIDVRLSAVRQDLVTACSRASAAGFNPETILELQLFADCFGAYRLNEACTQYISLCQRRVDLINQLKPRVEDQAVRSSWGSDMSIDDSNDDPSGSHQPSFQGKHLAGQEQRSLDTTIRSQARQQTSSSSLPVQHQKEKEEEKKEGAIPESSPGLPSQPSRRLSVQDRISLFENKQKENSGGKSISVGKSAELRRLSSDVSSAPAAEKAVLKRWSGASDMSIDTGNDRKDGNNTDSPLCIPSSSSAASLAKATVFPFSSEDNSKDLKDLHDPISASELKDQGELHTISVGGKGHELELKDNKVNWNDQGGPQAGAENNSFREVRSGVTFGRADSFGGDKDPVVIEGKPNHSRLRVPDSEFGKRVEDTEAKDHLPNHSRPKSHGRSLSGQFEGGLGGRSKNLLLHKEVAGDQSASQPQWRSFNSKAERAGKKDFSYSGRDSTKGENLEAPATVKMQKPVFSGEEQMKKLGDGNDESSVPFGSSKPINFGKRTPDPQESNLSAQASSIEQFQRVRQSKGNQELNDELKMKANELEKLFAEHKLRVPGDQSNPNRRNKPIEIQIEQQMATSIQKRPAAAAVESSPIHFQIKKVELEAVGNSDTLEFNTPPTKMLDQPDYSSSLRRNFSDLSFSDDSRGKFYETYMKKRDAKLREEWGTKRAEKEAKLKAMHDSLDRSRAEMKSKFSASADKQDSRARRRTEKLRSFAAHSSAKKQQLPTDLIQSDEDEDLPAYSEQFYGQDKSFNEAAGQNKKFTPNRNVSSSTRIAAAAPVPRSAVKSSNPSSGKRRTPSENHLAQSVPNFSEFRKENTKPFLGAGKTTNRSQVRNSRSKSNGEDVPLTKEDNKSRRSQALRKSTAGPPELKDLSPLTTDATILAPLKSDKDQIESKTFLKKGNGIGPGAGPGIAKLQASSAISETLRSEDEFEDSAFEMEDDPDVARDVAEEELETTEVEECVNVDNNGKSRLSHESEKMVMSESDNSDPQRSQLDISSVAELPASVPLAFGAVEDSPAESPVSWNMHPFSYQHETSDVDAFVDSPMGSPASWNSHSLSQAEADAAARMRKKWGSAQKPVLVSSSNNHSRKDVTKGFKRLIKFGRKSRGETLADWISATTSEGDDDTEDGRDPASRSSEDLRKSRMGFSHSHPSDDGFNEGELFNEQVQALHTSIPAPPANFKLRDDHASGSAIKGDIFFLLYFFACD